jgi:uncharacterized protein with PIN domain
VYGELGDFLLWADRGHDLVRPAPGAPTAKDVVEAIGVPHPEVDLIVVDGEPAGFGHRVAPGERIAVYPRFATIEPSHAERLVPEARPDERFVLDGHLGRLARWLRLLGVDTWYRNDAPDPELAQVSADEDRTLLTRDVGLLKRAVVRRGRWVRAIAPRAQVVEVLRRYPLGSPTAVPFSRCLACNGELVAVDKADVAGLVPPRSYEAFDDFRRCPRCGRAYWPGSHHDRLSALVDEVLEELGEHREGR